MGQPTDMIIKAVIFDLDGTITQPYLDFDAIREEMNLARDSGPILESMEKMTPERRKAVERILDNHEQNAIADSQLNDGAKQILDDLRASGIAIGVLTRNKKSNVLAIAQKHGLTFDAIVGREEGPAKPDAFGVLEICREFGVKPAEAMVVGDYLHDLLCAKAAGAIAVLFGSHKQAGEFAPHADFCIENLTQIMQIIKNSFNETDAGPSDE